MKKFTCPTLLIDKEKCLANIEMMAAKAEKSDVRLRPHFKTHQSEEVGSWFRDFGVKGITVSSIEMALHFAARGWSDITIAFPVNILEIENLNALASAIKLNLLVESAESVKFLAQRLKFRANIFIKIDTGYERTGIPSQNLQEIEELVNVILSSKQLHFKGFLAHSGHTYYAKSRTEIKAINRSTIEQMVKLRNHFSNIPNLELSIGDTPSCSVDDDFSLVDEIRPGNFVFYDWMQHQLGACDFSQIAVAMACPIVAKHESRCEVIIHGGAVHFSKDHLLLPSGEKTFGPVVHLQKEGWGAPIRGAHLASVSQEHGIVKCDTTTFQQLQIGKMIGIIPVHSCLTANLMKEHFFFID